MLFIAYCTQYKVCYPLTLIKFDTSSFYKYLIEFFLKCLKTIFSNLGKHISEVLKDLWQINYWCINHKITTKHKMKKDYLWYYLKSWVNWLVREKKGRWASPMTAHSPPSQLAELWIGAWTCAGLSRRVLWMSPHELQCHWDQGRCVASGLSGEPYQAGHWPTGKTFLPRTSSSRSDLILCTGTIT